MRTLDHEYEVALVRCCLCIEWGEPRGPVGRFSGGIIGGFEGWGIWGRGISVLLLSAFQ